MEILKLKARLRTGRGKSYTRKIRNQGWIPAVYYGHDRESKSIEVDAREFAAFVRHRKLTHLVDLDLPEEKGDSISIIKDIQRNVIKDNVFFHIDFQHVAMDEKIAVQCPLVLKGVPIGVKEDGGILSQQIRALTISCLPTDIPEFIEVDISEMKIGQALHVSDVRAEKVEIKDSPEDVVAVIVHPQTVEVAAPVTEEVPAEGEEAAAAEGEEKAAEGEEKKEEPEK